MVTSDPLPEEPASESPAPAEAPDATPAETSAIARNNEVIGAVASIVVLLISIGAGAGLMFGTGTRGTPAILTVLSTAAGTFCLLMLVVSGVLRALTPEEQWVREEEAWRRGEGLPPLADEPEDAELRARRRVFIGGTLALLFGLAISVLPAMA
ncbi:hypothetical protein [Nocardioides sp.]|uniref:hypothetical protein n=1 Tax=Nocardioides sp. TaxID=35761 RepID=UPI0035127D46